MSSVCDRGGRGDGMAGIGIAVEQLDRAVRPLHQGVVDRAAAENGAHRDAPVREPFRGGDKVGYDAKQIRGEGRAEPPESGNHFVEDEQNAVAVADRAQPLEIADRRNQHAGRTRDRLDDHGGDRFRSVQGDQSLEIVRELRSMLRLAFDEEVSLGVVRVPEMIDAWQAGKGAPVVDDTADGDAAEPDAVIAAFAADQPCARALADRALIGERDLERGVDRLGARAG